MKMIDQLNEFNNALFEEMEEIGVDPQIVAKLRLKAKQSLKEAEEEFKQAEAEDL